MTFTAYALPAMLALLAKAALFVYARFAKVHNTETRLYLWFLFTLSIQNLAEIVLFSELANSVPITPGARLWYSAVILAPALFLHLTLIVATGYHDNGRIGNRTLLVLYAPAVISEILLWSGPLFIVGFEPMAYSVTKVPGPLFFLWELYAVSYFLAILALLTLGARVQATALRRTQCKLLLISVIPLCALGVGIIVAQRFGFRGFNAAATLPLATTFFLCITAYAIHQYRVFDIAFFVPWSEVRKRKTAFYKRIQALIAEIAEMGSVPKIVQSLSDALRCPVVFLGGPKPALTFAGEALGIARFPVDELKKIDQILVVNEVAQAMPDIHALMKRHKVAAIVPFHPHSQAAASWMLLGDEFSEQVYSPLDFKMVEALFARLSDHFLDNQMLLRTQLTEAQQEMCTLHKRLANAWGQLETSRKELRTVAEENRLLKQKNTELLRNSLATVRSNMIEPVAATLDEHVAEFEARLIATVLEHCNDDPDRAAEILGISTVILYSKIRRCELAGS